MKVYVETSVISYLTARPSRDILVAANQQVTQEWWQDRREKFELYVSQLVDQEISSGDAEAIAKRQQALESCSFLDITPDAVELAGRLDWSSKERSQSRRRKMRCTSRLRRSAAWTIC